MRRTGSYIAILLWTIGILAGVFAETATSFAQGRIQNAAVARFSYRTGALDSLRSNTAVITVLSLDSLASSIVLTAFPRAIPGNQQDTAFLSATLLDKDGRPVPDGVTVVFATTKGRFPGGRDSLTVRTAGGRATTGLRSELVAGQIVSADVSAMTPGRNGIALLARTTVLFFPGAIRGSVLSARTGLPIQGARIVATEQGGSVVWADSTGADGSYLIPVRAAGATTHEISLVNRFGDPVVASFHTLLPIPAVGGIPASPPLNAIAGNLVDRSSGLPVRLAGVPVNLRLVRETHDLGGRSLTSLQTTDARGMFVFDSLNPGVYEIQVAHPKYSGTATIADTASGCFMVETDVGLDDRPGFELLKVAHKRVAEIGDAVPYTLELRNTSATIALAGITVVDNLPLGFVYVTNSSRLNQAPLGDPAGSATLRWSLADTLPPGKTLLLSYMTTLGAGAVEGDGINHASAIAHGPAGDTVRSGVTSVGVVVRPGVFTDRGIVIGKVFFDVNRNGSQESGENGIADVALWMEDGTCIITGDDGKYSLPEVLPGQHVIRLDRRTLPAGSKVIAYGSESAGDGTSRFIRLVEGGIARADFHILPPGQASLEMILRPGQTGQERIFLIRWNDSGRPSAISLIDTLARGFAYNLSSLQVNGSQRYPGGNPSRFLRVELGVRPAGSVDTVTVSLSRDTTSSHRSVSSRPRLVISYPRRRDAVFEPNVRSVRPPAPARVSPGTPIGEKPEAGPSSTIHKDCESCDQG